MYYFIFAISAITLSMIAYQDFRSRSVYWFYFPLLTISGIILGFLELKSNLQLFQYAFFNVFFLAMQLFFLKVYFFLRHKKIVKIVDKKMGLGDILFLIAACFFFSPFNFIVFYISSLLFSIIYYALYKVIKGSSLKTLPLAGLQALFLFICFGVRFLFKYSMLNDNWLIDKLVF